VVSLNGGRVEYPIQHKTEGDMHNLVPIGQFFGGFFGGLGIFFLGCAAFWFVSVYSQKMK
jgi:hypothetical protein